MNASDAICYVSLGDKRRRFPVETVKMILSGARRAAREDRQRLAQWLDGSGALDLPDRSLEQLAAMHQAARAGRYVPAAPLHCDLARGVGETLDNGGDCDQWAVVLLAALKLLEYPAYLVAGGDASDPYRHVWVRARAGGRWWDLDPKGSQAGMDFGHSADFERAQSWPL